jgi:amino acid adenylation domain-containing protein
MLGHFRQVLERALESTERRLSQLTVLSDPERDVLLRDWNATTREFPAQCVPALFGAQAARSPQAVAVQAADGELTYAALHARVAGVVARLAALGVRAGDRVGICVERTLDLPVAVLAVMASGAAYVPLDPAFPAERLRYMADDAGVALVITQGRLETQWPGRPVLDLEAEAEALQARTGARALPDVDAHQLAYVIYTSGSTGLPKGVCIEHGALANFLCSMRERPGLDANDTLVSVTTASFDIFGLELFLPLVTGARLVLASREQTLDGAALARLLESSAATVLQATPATWRMLLESGWRGREHLKALCGGEALPPALTEQLLARVGSLWNVYGPTETTIWSTLEEVDSGSIGSTVSIGRPIANTRVYVLDEHMQPVPIGVSGELWIGGAGVARGYWQRPELTAERFVTDPFVAQAGARMYRTGDRARWRRDGRLEHLGRLDHQIKLRGYRIELGEVEAVLEGHEGVTQAVVATREMAGETRLVAYAVGETRDARVLDAYARERLPGYMVPGAWVFLDALPLTPNGKVDRRSLPEPEVMGLGAAKYVAPRSRMERTVAEIWRQVLDLERVGVHDGFFELGGHSLQLTGVRARLESALGRRIAMADLFRYPTVEAFAASLGAGEPETSVLETARTRLHARPRESQADHAVAIVGMGLRFPGASDAEAFWRVLAEGIEPLHVFTPEELRAAGLDEALLAHPNYVNRRGILEGYELFDAGFFGYSPREAELLDPQQRLFLECAWEALEGAGYDPRGMEVPVGVYAGSAMNMYLLQLYTRPDLIAMAGGTQALIGSDIDYLPMRVSYKLNLRGPSVNLQTTCSTSLVAVHMACRSLRAGECDLALAGAANLRLPVAGGHVYQEGGVLSPDGSCRAFDAAGAGTLFGDGVGVVALKRLRDALADGDPIRAVIRGTAVNNDGSDKVGFTAPNVNAQAEVIATALADADVPAPSIGYVEAHGTATALGDPIEVAALNQVFAGCERASSALGTVKSNFGHLDRVAGIAGLIKTVLALEHRQIPPSLHFREPNPEIDFDAGPFFVNTVLRDWAPRGQAPRRAGVSSFGMGGSNAHVVLEEAPELPADGGATRSWQLLPLSARSAAALGQVCERLAQYLDKHAEAVNLADVAHTLQRGRRAFEHRLALVVRDVEQARRALAADSAERRPAPAVQGSPQVVFMFPGQGAQHPDMGKGLYDQEPVFRQSLERCCEILRPHLGYDLREALYPRDGVTAEQAAARLAHTSVTQPALFAVEYALAQLWLSWGIRPAAMIGHSVGEYVAACVSGVLQLEDALSLVATRGRLMEQAPAGVMLAVLAAESRVVELLGEEQWLAAVNGPQACTVSGTAASIEALEASLAAQNISCRRLVTSHAFHSGLMEPVLGPLTAVAAKLRLGEAKLRYVSNVSGDWIGAQQLADPGYWARHTREPVRFDAGLTTILETLGSCALLEVGPGRGLTQLVRARLVGRAGSVAVSSLGVPSGQRDDVETLTRALSELWVAGVAPDWKAYAQGYRARRIALPTYPFERKRFWVESGAQARSADANAFARKEDLADWFSVPTWQRTLAPSTPSAAAAEAENWLLFADACGLASALAARLRAEGHRVAVVAAADAYRAGTDEFALAPEQSEHYDKLLDDLEARDRTPQRIVFLWAVTGSAEPDAAALVERCFHAPVRLVQCLGRRGLGAPVRMTWVSDELHEVTGGETVVPEKALILGPCRVFAQEYPQLACRNIDLPQWSPTHDRSLEVLLEELKADDAAEPIVAYRNGYRWIPRHTPARLEALPGKPARLRERGVYLITGGLGGIGLSLAGYLAESVQARLVLLSRRGLPPETQWDGYLESHAAQDATARAIQAVRALRAQGASVLVEAADVADRQQMQDLLARVRSQFGAPNGVIHAAGLAGGGLTQLKTQAAADAVLRPKVAGTRVLGELLRESPPDFMLLCSSINALFGVAGQIDYTAANAYLDAFALRQRKLSPTFTVSVNWDAWREIGMAVDTKVPGSMAAERQASLRLGIGTAEGVEAFRRVLLSDWPQVFVSPRAMPTRVVRTAVEDAPQESAPAVSSHSRPDLNTEFVAPRSETETQLGRIWSQVLGIDRVGIHDDFLELGGHSLLALQLISRLRSELGVELSLETIFRAPTVAQLAERVDAERAAPAQDRVGSLRDKLKNLSPDERKALLAEARQRKVRES